MKVFIALLALLALVAAEPPRYRTLGRQSAPPAAPADAPYPPSGWKPQGARLTLPARQTAPDQKYGPPSASYGPPTQEYGPPESTTDGAFEESTTLEPDAEFTPANEAERLRQRNQRKNAKIERGQYYVLLEDGRLQRVIYMTESDLKNMGFTARLRYQNVEPINGPIFNSAQFRAPFVATF